MGANGDAQDADASPSPTASHGREDENLGGLASGGPSTGGQQNQEEMGMAQCATSPSASGPEVTRDGAASTGQKTLEYSPATATPLGTYLGHSRLEGTQPGTAETGAMCSNNSQGQRSLWGQWFHSLSLFRSKPVHQQQGELGAAANSPCPAPTPAAGIFNVLPKWSAVADQQRPGSTAAAVAPQQVDYAACMFRACA